MNARVSRAIAIIGGTGPAGMGLALRWARAGETVIIGSRDAARAQQTAEAIRKRVGANAQLSGMENSAACAACDLLVLTVPFDGQAALLKQLKQAIRPGSILIDATVPLAASVGGRASRTLGVWQGSAAQQTAELVPKGVSVVAAFQNRLGGRAQQRQQPRRGLRRDRMQRRSERHASRDGTGVKIRARASDRWRQTGERAHCRADHRAADRPQHSAQRARWNTDYRIAGERLQDRAIRFLHSWVCCLVMT
jgi:NADPH-dependent F420 reductase